MSMTRANAEQELIARTGALLTAAGLDGVTTDGTNASLNGPLGYGIRKLSLIVANNASVGDADVAQVADARLDEFLDLAELRALMNALGNYDAVNLRAGPRSEDFSTLGTRLQKMIEDKRDFIQAEYGRGLAELQAGTILLDFEQRSDPYNTIILPV